MIAELEAEYQCRKEVWEEDEMDAYTGLDKGDFIYTMAGKKMCGRETLQRYRSVAKNEYTVSVMVLRDRTLQLHARITSLHNDS